MAASARALDSELGATDREKMDQYLTSLNEVEARLVASEKWIDIPLKKQDYSHLNLNATNEGDPAEYYRNMFDLIALAFDADITRTVTFMLNREDGMGISDTFPLKLGLSKTHHNLSHATDKPGNWISRSTTCSLARNSHTSSDRLNKYRDRDGAYSTTRSSSTAAAPAPRTTTTTCRPWSLAAPTWASNTASTGVRETEAHVEPLCEYPAGARSRAGKLRGQHRNPDDSRLHQELIGRATTCLKLILSSRGGPDTPKLLI